MIILRFNLYWLQSFNLLFNVQCPEFDFFLNPVGLLSRTIWGNLLIQVYVMLNLWFFDDQYWIIWNFVQVKRVWIICYLKPNLSFWSSVSFNHKKMRRLWATKEVSFSLIQLFLFSAAAFLQGSLCEPQNSQNLRGIHNLDYNAVFRVQGNVYPDGYLLFFIIFVFYWFFFTFWSV